MNYSIPVSTSGTLLGYSKSRHSGLEVLGDYLFYTLPNDDQSTSTADRLAYHHHNM